MKMERPLVATALVLSMLKKLRLGKRSRLRHFLGAATKLVRFVLKEWAIQLLNAAIHIILAAFMSGAFANQTAHSAHRPMLRK
jgi:hypothetical protein